MTNFSKHVSQSRSQKGLRTNPLRNFFSLEILSASATKYFLRQKLGGVVVGRWTHERKVAGSTPGRCIAGQQLWASCSHPCASAPSSIIW